MHACHPVHDIHTPFRHIIFIQAAIGIRQKRQKSRDVFQPEYLVILFVHGCKAEEPASFVHQLSNIFRLWFETLNQNSENYQQGEQRNARLGYQHVES